MADYDDIISKVRIQYPTNDPASLQRSITQIKDLLEDEEFYEAMSSASGGAVVRILSGGSGGGGIVLSFLGLIDTPSNYSGDGGKFARVAAGETELVFEEVVEADITDLDRVRWVDPYVPNAFHRLNDMVRDGDWAMIANKDTSDRAAPQEADDPQYTLPDLPLWSYNQNQSVVESGAEYIVDAPITLVGYQVWIPTITADINYVIRTFAYPTDDPDKIKYQEISGPLLLEDTWTTIAVNQLLVTAGTTIGLRISALNSGGSTQVGPFDWTRGPSQNTAAPATGEWNKTNNNGTLRISFTDADAADRTGDLTGIIAGSTISIVNKADATESATYTTTSSETVNGASYEWSVTLDDTGAGGEPAVGDVCVVTITVPLPAPTDYVVNIGGHAAQPNTKGYLAFNGVEQPGNEDNAFGVRLLVDTYSVSSDWDVVAYSGNVSGT